MGAEFGTSKWLTFSNVIANEFNVVMASPYLNQVHICPPQWMVDEYFTPTELIELRAYNGKIYDNITNDTESPCHDLLEEATDTNSPTDPDWEAYNNYTENWFRVDVVAAWAKREQQRGNPVYVHINPLIWDHDGTSPHWFNYIDLSQNDEYESWTEEEHLTILQLIKEYIEVPIERYCSDTIFQHYINPQDPPPTPGPHPYNGTNMNGVVAVYQVVNEVTNENGSVRQMNNDLAPDNTNFAWAMVNQLVYSPTLDSGGYGNGPLYNSDLFHAYNPNYPSEHRDYEDYYVYQAFQYAQNAVTEHCGGAGEIVPKLSLNSNTRVDLLIEDIDSSDLDNDWARGTIDLIQDVNDGPDLIDELGIQSHLAIRPNEPTPTPGASPTPGATPTKDGSARGLRSVLEFARESDLDVRITELDVQMIRFRPLNDPNAHFTPTLAATYFPVQADVYRNVFYQCLYNDEGDFDPICTEVTMWGLFDGIDENDCYYPRLFSYPNPNSPCALLTPTLPPGTPAFAPSGTPTLINLYANATTTPIPAYYPKSAHQKSYRLLQQAPTPFPPPNSAYPEPPRIPTPLPTANPYP